MRVTEVWEIEEINWVNPLVPGFASSDVRRRAVGLTPNQMSHRAGNRFQVLKYMSPQKFLDVVDPLFTPGDDSLEWLRDAIDDGLPFTPLQVWLTFEEYLYWPYVNEWDTFRRDTLRRIKRGEEVSFDEHRRLIRTHEGRHRAWLARELGETEVPVTVWISENK